MSELEWVSLRWGMWNAGSGSVADGLDMMHRCDVLCGAEWSDQGKLKQALREAGFRVVEPDVPGAPATPVVYDPRRLLLVRTIGVPLFPGGLDIGPGTGPDHAKAKALVGAVFVDLQARRRLCFCAKHRYAGHKPGNLREHYATVDAQRTVDHLEHLSCVTCVGGDWNAEPDKPCLDPMRRGGYVCDQVVLDRIATHGGWCPDHGWVRRDGQDRVRMAGHQTVRNGSDHDGLVVELHVRRGSHRSGHSSGHEQGGQHGR